MASSCRVSPDPALYYYLCAAPTVYFNVIFHAKFPILTFSVIYTTASDTSSKVLGEPPKLWKGKVSSFDSSYWQLHAFWVAPASAQRFAVYPGIRLKEERPPPHLAPASLTTIV